MSRELQQRRGAKALSRRGNKIIIELIIIKYSNYKYMHYVKSHVNITVLEAVEQIAHISALSWHGPEYAMMNREQIRRAFTAILEYLQRFYEREKGSLSRSEVQRGIQAVMLLTAEAAQKMDLYEQQMGTKEESVCQLKEYQDLQHFYASRIVERARHHIGLGEGWQNAWNRLVDKDLVQSPHALTWDKVCQDLSYELFFFKPPLFGSNLLRHLHLVGAFDLFLSEVSEEDLFFRLTWVEDWNRHEGAREILDRVRPDMDRYFRVAMQYKQHVGVRLLNQAVIALMMAANPKHLKQSGSTKSCAEYRIDCLHFLREAMTSSIPEKIRAPWISLLQSMVSALFMREERFLELPALWKGLLKEGMADVHCEEAVKSPHSLWLALEDEDALLRAALKKHPNGPLMKAIDLLSRWAAGEQLMGYDPILQGDVLGMQYSLSVKGKEVMCLRLPVPVTQDSLDVAVIVPEFRTFLQGVRETSSRHLMVLLEDPAAELSRARCSTLLNLQKEEGEALSLLVFPKSGEFYTQSGKYLSMDEASVFMEALCSFQYTELLDANREIATAIHQRYFDGKKQLTRANRLDFIELFFHSLVMEVLNLGQHDTLSFTCKDGIDASSASSAGFYVFSGNQNKEKLIELLYGAPLFIRHRALDPDLLARCLSFCKML